MQNLIRLQLYAIICTMIWCIAFVPRTYSTTIHSTNETKINGGHLAPPKQFPQFVSLRMLNLAQPHFCSGNILNTNWIITTAICVGERTNLKRIVLIVGTNRMQDPGYKYYIDYVIRHPDFTGRQGDFLAHNIGLIRTTEPIVMTARVQPIGLFRNAIDENHSAIVAGWKKVC